jgi:hypothetical protein
MMTMMMLATDMTLVELWPHLPLTKVTQDADPWHAKFGKTAHGQGQCAD